MNHSNARRIPNLNSKTAHLLKPLIPKTSLNPNDNSKNEGDEMSCNDPHLQTSKSSHQELNKSIFSLQDIPEKIASDEPKIVSCPFELPDAPEWEIKPLEDGMGSDTNTFDLPETAEWENQPKKASKKWLKIDVVTNEELQDKCGIPLESMEYENDMYNDPTSHSHISGKYKLQDIANQENHAEEDDGFDDQTTETNYNVQENQVATERYLLNERLGGVSFEIRNGFRENDAASFDIGYNNQEHHPMTELLRADKSVVFQASRSDGGDQARQETTRTINFEPKRFIKSKLYLYHPKVLIDMAFKSLFHSREIIDFDTVSDALLIHDLKQLEPDSICRLSWTFAKRGIRDIKLFKLITYAVLWRLDEYTHKNVSTIIWSVSKLKITDPKLYSALSRTIIDKNLLQEYTPSELVNTLHAHASSGNKNLELFTKATLIFEQNENIIESFDLRYIVFLLWCFSKVGLKARTIYSQISMTISKRKMLDSHFTPSELCNLLYSFAVSAEIDDDLTSKALQTILEQNMLCKFTSRELAKVVWSFSKSTNCVFHEGSSGNHVASMYILFTTVSARLLKERIFKSYFTPKDFTLLLWAFAKMKFRARNLYSLCSKGIIDRNLIPSFGSRDLPDLLWAYSRQDIINAQLFQEASWHVEKLYLRPRQWAAVLGALSKLKKPDVALFKRVSALIISQNMMQVFKGQEIATVLYAYKKVGLFDEELYLHAITAIENREDFWNGMGEKERDMVMKALPLTNADWSRVIEKLNS